MRNAVAGGETVWTASVVSKLRHPSFIDAFLLAETSFQRIQHRNKLADLRPVQLRSFPLAALCDGESAVVTEFSVLIEVPLAVLACAASLQASLLLERGDDALGLP